jgi:hypothetical protein
MRITVGTIARYYLRLAWLYRESATYYEGTDVAAFAEGLAKVGSRWRKELPDHSEYPASPGLALDEVQALKFSRAYFQRNYETLKEAKLEEELRLRLLLAEIGFRLGRESERRQQEVATAYWKGRAYRTAQRSRSASHLPVKGSAGPGGVGTPFLHCHWVGSCGQDESPTRLANG